MRDRKLPKRITALALSMALIFVMAPAAYAGGGGIPFQSYTATTFAELQRAVADYAATTDDMVITIGADILLTSNLLIRGNEHGRTLTITNDDTIRTLSRGINQIYTHGGLIIIDSDASVILENIIIDGDKDAYPENGASIIYLSSPSAMLELRDGAVLKKQHGIIFRWSPGNLRQFRNERR